MTKLSEVVLDCVTKIKSRNISFLPCKVMHGKETSTHGIRNCWTGDGIKISGSSNLRMRSRKRRTKKKTRLRTLLLPFEHYERRRFPNGNTMSSSNALQHPTAFFNSPRYHTSQPTFREDVWEILIEQCFLPSHGLRWTKISKFVEALRLTKLWII